MLYRKHLANKSYRQAELFPELDKTPLPANLPVVTTPSTPLLKPKEPKTEVVLSEEESKNYYYYEGKYYRKPYVDD